MRTTVTFVSFILVLALLTGCGSEPATPVNSSPDTAIGETAVEAWNAELVPSYANYDELRPGANIHSESTIALIEKSLANTESFMILLEHYKSRGYQYAPSSGSFRAFVNAKGVPFIGLSYNAWNDAGAFSVLTSLYQIDIENDRDSLTPAYTYLIENEFSPRTAPILTWVEGSSIRKMRRPILEEMLNAR